MAALDILMITHDRLDYLKKSLPSVLNQSFKQWHLTIWDNDSRQITKEYLKNINDPRIRVYYNWDNESLASITTRFIRRSGAEFIGKVDSDMIIPEDWASRLIAKHKEGHYGFLGGFHFRPEDLMSREPIITRGVWYKKHIGGQFIIRRIDFKGYDGEGVMGLSEYQEQTGPNGYLWNPVLFVDHMEDARSEHYLDNSEYNDYKFKTRGISLAKYQMGISNKAYLDENCILR